MPKLKPLKVEHDCFTGQYQFSCPVCLSKWVRVESEVTQLRDAPYPEHSCALNGILTGYCTVCGKDLVDRKLKSV